MAEGFLGGLSGFGDFLTGGGVYADPKNINPTYGVPEGDVRQAAINQLGQISALLLAAGQPMEGSQRAQLLAQIGGTGSQFNTNLYNASQRRLMTAQMQEKQRDIEELNAIRDLQQKDPEGFAKRIGGGVTAEMIRTFSPADLRDITKKITIQRATEGTDRAILSSAFGGAPAPAGAVPAQAGAAPTEMAQPAQGQQAGVPAAVSQKEIFLQTLPQQSRALVLGYENAISQAAAAGRTDLVEKYTNQLNAAVPELKTFKTNIAEIEAKKISSAPDAYATSVGLVKLLDEAIAHPGREAATGKSWLASYIPASDASGFVQRIEQIKGNTFTSQVSKLVGMGALSNAEGIKITQAAARLEKLNVSEEEYLTALRDLRRDTYLAVQRSLKNIGGRPLEGYPVPSEDVEIGRPQQAAPSRITTQPQGSITGRARIISVE
jgi:hypothetical protein